MASLPLDKLRRVANVVGVVAGSDLSAAELKKPTFILHPAKDVLVPVGQARELLEALKKNSAPVWYAEFGDATHNNFPSTAANQNWMLASWIVFVQKFLLN